MAIPLMEYAVKPVYAKISDRFMKKYNIHLGNHIDSMSNVSNRAEEGITFVPRDDQRLIAALKATQAFHHDDRANLVGELAAAATTGEGYREIADTALTIRAKPIDFNAISPTVDVTETSA